MQARQNVIVIAATNRLDCIDPALTRPGRFDRILSIPPPDAGTREAILKVHTRYMPLAVDVDLHDMAAKCWGYSGADIMALCREAALAALETDISAKYVNAEDFRTAFARIVPSFC
jgi:transitional endoplasmic reticulum ATPase